MEQSGHEQPWMSENQAKKALATAEKTKEELAMSEVARERCWGGGGGWGEWGAKQSIKLKIKHYSPFLAEIGGV